MVTDHLRHAFGGEVQRADVKPGFAPGLAAPFTRRFDYDYAAQAWPAMACLEPCHVVDDRVTTRLDAAMIAVDGFMAADFGVLECACLLFGDEEFHVVAERSLIALEREDVIGLLLQNLFGDGALAPHGVDGDDGAFDFH